MARLQNAFKEIQLPEYYQMTEDLISTLKGKQYDCIQMMRLFQERWGIDEDHHHFAEVMDHMATKGMAKVVRGGGYTVYEIL